MCGILGIVSSAADTLSTSSGSVLRSLEHRGPDDSGAYTESGLFLGHTRLAIIDLTQSGRQPMTYKHAGRTLTIVFNGEIYNYLELREELRALGFSFTSQSDTEVILAAYAAWGEAALLRFNGMFAFAIWDTERKMLFAARDRFGKKPFVYSTDGNRLSFASEIKALRALDVRPLIDPQKAYAYLLVPDLHYFGETTTFFSNVLTLPGGAALTWQHGALNVRQWWQFEDRRASEPIRSKEEGIQKIRSTLEDAVALRLRSDVPVGLALSGGVDSSILLTILSRIHDSTHPLHTFTVCHSERVTDERALVREMLSSLSESRKIESHFFEFPRHLDPEDILQFCRVHDEPIRSFDVFNQFYLMKKIQETGLKVVMSGQGADELLWGYPRYYVHFAAAGLVKGNLNELAAGLAYTRKFYGLSHFQALRRIGSVALPGRALGTRRTLIDSIWREVRSCDAMHTYASPLNLAMFQANEITRMHLPSLLRDEDRNSMHFGIETRAPFLDYRMGELAMRMPPKWNLHNGFTKYMLRSAFQNELPTSIVWRTTKSGLYEKRTIRYVLGFRDFMLRIIAESPFLRQNIRFDRLGSQSDDVIWRLFNIAAIEHA